MLILQDDLIIDAARRQIVTAGIKMVEQKMIAGSWGNLSIKIDTSRCAITPSGRSYDSLNTEDIVVVDMQGNKIKGALIPSSETPLHLAIYNAIPAAQAIVHTHSVYASACAALHRSIPALIEDLVQIIGGSVDVAEYALPGTKVLAENALIALKNKKAALLANHGVVCWGISLETALMTAEIVEKYVHKGDKLYIEGKLRTRNYDDSKGVKRYITEVFVDSIEMLTPKVQQQAAPVPPPLPTQQPTQRQQQQVQQPAYQQQPYQQVSPPDDLPF